jgi:Predicted metalloprotease
MRWVGRRQSTNVEDRRRVRPGGMIVGGGIGTIVIVVLALLLGGDPGTVLDQLQNASPPGAATEQTIDPAQEPLKQFASVVLGDTEVVWTAQFEQMGETYQPTTLVLFSGSVESACGLAGAAAGPFYCPTDQKVYLDLSFFDELTRKFGAPGDFAQTYVIAHEVGHHVQDLLGISDQVRALEKGASEAEVNDLSVRMELQADFLAGMWAHYARQDLQVLDPGDIEEALRAASAIGDDRLQMEAQGYVVPDSFTHGTSEQRSRWFRRGFDTGDLSQGDTFQAETL